MVATDFVIYCWSCKDPNVKRYYIGKSKLFKQRKRQHNLSSSSLKCPSQKLYAYVRDNGGKDNWEFSVLHYCKDENEMNVLEHFYICLLKPSLNKSIRWDDFPEKFKLKFNNAFNLKCCAENPFERPCDTLIEPENA